MVISDQFHSHVVLQLCLKCVACCSFRMFPEGIELNIHQRLKRIDVHARSYLHFTTSISMLICKQGWSQLSDAASRINKLVVVSPFLWGSRFSNDECVSCAYTQMSRLFVQMGMTKHVPWTAQHAY